MTIEHTEYLEIWTLTAERARAFCGAAPEAPVVVLKERPETDREIAKYRPDAKLFGVKLPASKPHLIVVGDFVSFLDAAFKTVKGKVIEVAEIGEDNHRAVMVHTTSNENVIVRADACMRLPKHGTPQKGA
jgi:transcription antitermination factor NusG